MDDLSDAAFVEAVRLQMAGDAAADRLLGVRFYMEEVEDEEASKTEGRPIFKSVEMVEIRVPGDKDMRRGRVKNTHPDPRKRFPEAYAKFKAGELAQVNGQLLRAWGRLMPHRVREYEAVGVLTVEQLAALSDVNAQGFPGAIADRQKARDFLDEAKGQAPIAQARAENEKLRAELESLKSIISQQGQKIEAMTSDEPEQPKRRGRPPKAQAEG